MIRLFLACALALAALTGCASGSSVSAEPAATIRSPLLPTAAEQVTSAGALAFARHYLRTLNYARATGDVSGLVPLEDGDCQTCQALRHAISQVYDNGGTITGGAWKVESLSASKDAREWSVDGQINVARQRISGTPTDDEVVPAKSVAVTGTLVRWNGSWKVTSWVRAV